MDGEFRVVSSQTRTMIGYLLSSKYLLVASEASNCAPGLVKKHTHATIPVSILIQFINGSISAHAGTGRAPAYGGAEGCCLTGGDAVEGVVGADGVEIDAGEVDGAAVGGQEEAQEAAPVAAVRFQERRRRVHVCWCCCCRRPLLEDFFGEAEEEELRVRSAQRKQLGREKGGSRKITEEMERGVWCGRTAAGMNRNCQTETIAAAGRWGPQGGSAVFPMLKCFLRQRLQTGIHGSFECKNLTGFTVFL